MKRILPLLLLVLLLLLAVGVVSAQDPDTDGDTIPDNIDSCPDIAGIPEMGGCPDTDSDTISDPYDACPAEAGLTTNYGCPEGVIADLDGDGVPEAEDYCFNTPGTPELNGCTPETFPDYDQDTVADLDDACFDQAGLADNSGCPEGVVPDLDFDTVPDAEDQCPRIPGPAENNGCIFDLDADQIADEQDGCPDQAGLFENYGCPEGVAPPDTDADNIPDLGDACPDEAGAPETGGCADTDGDTLGDPFDRCPDEPGVPEIEGCPRVENVTLPAVAPLTAENAAQVTQVGELVIAPLQFSVGRDNRLSVLNLQGISIYDLNATDLAPTKIELTASGPFAAASAGDVLATATMDFATGGSLVTLRNATSQEPIFEFAPEEPNMTTLYLTPDGTRLVTVHAGPFSPDIESTITHTVIIWNAADGTEVARWDVENGVAFLAFSPDGAFVAGQTFNQQGFVWNIADGSVAFTLEGPLTPSFSSGNLRFSQDGTKLAVALADGTLTIYDVPAFTQSASYVVTDAANSESITAMDFSPDGTLIAAGTGNIYYAGPPPTEFEPAYALRIINAATGETLANLPLEDPSTSGPIGTVAFNQQGSLVITSNSYRLRFWGVAQ
jgi:hypothetical protein